MTKIVGAYYMENIEVPEKYEREVEMKVAERTVKVLGGD